jgi:hypothetical protein
MDDVFAAEPIPASGNLTVGGRGFLSVGYDLFLLQDDLVLPDNCFSGCKIFIQKEQADQK